MRYIYTILTLLFVVSIGYFSFGVQNNKSAKVQRIACHQKTVVFEKVYDKSLLKQIQNTLKSGNYKLSSRAQKSRYMKTRLFEYVDIKEVDKLVKNTIAQYKTEHNTDNTVGIDYYIYENDKADPGKRTAKSKLYAGYVRFTFTYKGKRVYAVQVDFMDLDGKDIHKSVACAIESMHTIEI